MSCEKQETSGNCTQVAQGEMGLAAKAEHFIYALDCFDHARRVDGQTPGGADDLYSQAEENLASARGELVDAIHAAKRGVQ